MMQRPSRGAFILFEGVDRSGKTTQAKMLVKALTDMGKTAMFMRFPDRQTPIGKQIDAYLTNSKDLDDHVIHLLFSANRWEQRNKILSSLKDGVNIVMDRYAYSGVAFTAAKSKNIDFEWCKAPDDGLPMPDCIIYMDVNEEMANQRGGFGTERYETQEMQRNVRREFAKMKEESRAVDVNLWEDVDASGSVEEVSDRIINIVNGVLNKFDNEDVPLRTLWKGNIFE